MAKLFNEAIAAQVQEIFDQMAFPVQILLFTQETCDYCPQTQQLLEELVEMSGQLSLRVYDLDAETGLAKQYKVERTPGIVIMGKQVDGDQTTLTDYGIRYAGIPAGHEFTSLVNDLVMVGSRNSGLSDTTRQILQKLSKPVHLTVFTTPECPHCPRAVVLAHQMALESPWVEAEMIDAIEFPEIAAQYNVSGVPQTTINFGARTIVGALPEEYLIVEIAKILEEA
jgi:glutaredoxin-like protein